MVTRTGYRDGEPSWVDVTVPDLAAAREFYGGLFGWDFQDAGPDFGHYTMCLRGGRVVAALTPPVPAETDLGESAELAETGVPPMWSVYLATSDAAETARRMNAADAKILIGPLAVPGAGSMIYAFDPAGTAFGVWQAGEHTGSQVFGEPGALCWAEIHSPDGAGTDAFYRSLFGYDQTQLNEQQSVWTIGGEPVCGRLTATPGHPHWLIYFAVDDLDAGIRTASRLGGSVRRLPDDSPRGRWAIVADPAGAEFALITPPRS